jgi:hypothetical protein
MSGKVTPIRPGITNKKIRKRQWKSGANWDVLEHYYRVGWTLSDIAALPEAKGITTQAISNRIRRYKWSRNLEPRVADAARAIMAGGLDPSGKPSPDTLALLRGDKTREDAVVLTSAAQVADRLLKTRKRSQRLDTIIDRVADLIEGEITKLETEASEDEAESNARVRTELARMTKSLGTLVAAVTRANEEERNVNDLKRLMKPKEEIKPLLVKKRAVVDEEDASGDEGF